MLLSRTKCFFFFCFQEAAHLFSHPPTALRGCAVFLFLLVASGGWQADGYASQSDSRHVTGGSKLDNASCQACHAAAKKEISVTAAEGKKRTLHAVSEEKFSQSVHAKMLCVECHQEITDNTTPHKKNVSKKVGCVECHQNLWAATTEDIKKQGKSRLGVVVQNIEAYKKSFHARPNQDDPTRPNASCNDCHDTHAFNVPPLGSDARTAWHLTIPDTCGPKCHEEQFDTFKSSAHGKQVLEKHNPKGAVCTDCHTTHNIINTSSDPFKLNVTKVCGGCHVDNMKSYVDTYHGQVNTLGYAYTAKCYDCHGSHGILGRMTRPQKYMSITG